MKLKYILQSEKSQYEKATYYMVPIIRSSRKKKKTIQMIKWSVVTKDLGQRKEEWIGKTQQNF